MPPTWHDWFFGKNAENAGTYVELKEQMNRNKILEGILGNLIVALTGEIHRTARNKQEVHVLLSDALRDVLTLPQCPYNTPVDE